MPSLTLPARTAGRVGVLPFSINAMFYPFRSRAFLSQFLQVYFSCCDLLRHKKGGDNDLKKLRSGAKRNGAILTFLMQRYGE